MNQADKEWLQERAAIMEYDGGLSREKAQEQAYRCLDKLKRMGDKNARRLQKYRR